MRIMALLSTIPHTLKLVTPIQKHISVACFLIIAALILLVAAQSPDISIRKSALQAGSATNHHSTNANTSESATSSDPSLQISGNTSKSQKNGNTNQTSSSSRTQRSSTILPVRALPYLTISPSTVTLPPTGSVKVTVSAEDGTPIPQPTVNQVNGLSIYIPQILPPVSYPGGVYKVKSWDAFISRSDYDSGGNTMVAFTIPGGASASVRVQWSPAPSFTVATGPLTRSDSVDTITYTAHFTLQTNNPYFGNPQITMHIVNNPACLNTSTLSRTVTYDGTNDYSLDCTVQKIPPYIPGTGYPPPIAGSLNIAVEIYGRLADGNFIKGPGSNIYFNTPAPYNQ